jgi:hypothetical protein
MINLERLENMLEEALKNETAESLTRWICAQRDISSITNFVGEGWCEAQDGSGFAFSCKNTNHSSVSPCDNHVMDEDISIAA